MRRNNRILPTRRINRIFMPPGRPGEQESPWGTAGPHAGAAWGIFLFRVAGVLLLRTFRRLARARALEALVG